MIQKIPQFFRFFILLSVLPLVFFSVYRLAYWYWFNNPDNPVPFNELIYAFYLGLKFDLRLVLIILLPLFLFGGIRVINPLNNKYAYRAWFSYATLAFAFVTLVFFLDFGHYAYLHKPLDASVLRFLSDFSISANMMWETYPIVWIGLLLASTVAAYIYAQKKLYTYASNLSRPTYKWWAHILIGAVMFVTYVLALNGKLAHYPLRWSDAFASTHNFAPAVALNPMLHFIDTYKNKRIDFDEAKARKSYPVIAKYLGIKNDTLTGDAPLDYKRTVNTPGSFAAQQPNVVMVFLESFATYKTGAFGNPLNPTPEFDKIAKQGILFSNFYTPSTGTARSVFTATTGIPDVEKNRTASRNPLIVDQHSIINAYKGYEKFYFLGGSANWGNVRGVLAHNIDGLKIYEEGSYTAERIDVWGISDLSLFEEANKVLQKQRKPFFAIIQTSGNHRPYTIPEDSRGFNYIKISDKDLRAKGFHSEAEYNAFRFMDHSIGHFLKLAKQANYFDNTLFVFFGDHGITGDAGKHTAKYKDKFDLTGLQVPFLLYAPKLLTPEVVRSKKPYDYIASEVDVLPTIAGLTAPSYINTTLGRDLLEQTPGKQYYAFMRSPTVNDQIGLIGQRFFFSMNNDGSNKKLHDLQATDFSHNVIAEYSAIGKKMVELNNAFYQTARYMLYHNKNEVTKP